MKRLVCIFCIWVSMAGCQEEKEYLFQDVARVQFVGQGDLVPEDLVYSFVWLGKDRWRDTVYLSLRVLGGPAEVDRCLKVSQIEEYDVTYERDNKGYIIDSVVVVKKNKAVPGIHYVAFDDPEVQNLMRVRANHVVDSLPVILLRDSSLTKEKMRLKIKLENSDDFQLGERGWLTKTVIFSDKLEKPDSWNYTTDRYLGKYSESKYELMILVVKDFLGSEYLVDDEWIERGNKDNAIFVFWRGKFIEKLNEFNENPENIASGKAPLRENSEDPNSDLIKFPTKI